MFAEVTQLGAERSGREVDFGDVRWRNSSFKYNYRSPICTSGDHILIRKILSTLLILLGLLGLCCSLPFLIWFVPASFMGGPRWWDPLIRLWPAAAGFLVSLGLCVMGIRMERRAAESAKEKLAEAERERHR